MLRFFVAFSWKIHEFIFKLIYNYGEKYYNQIFQFVLISYFTDVQNLEYPLTHKIYKNVGNIALD